MSSETERPARNTITMSLTSRFRESQRLKAEHAPQVNGTADKDRIKLQVGERQFVTTRDTLTSESAYFRARLSGRWSDADVDGTYFVDSDPAVFEHILRYLRNGNLPLLFSVTDRTFDYVMYQALLGEARYFGVAKLEQWIGRQGFHEAVAIQHTTRTFTSEESFREAVPATSTADTNTSFSLGWGTRRSFVCPQMNPDHQYPQDCNPYCRNLRNSDAALYKDVPIFTAVMVQSQLVWKPEACLATDVAPDLAE